MQDALADIEILKEESVRQEAYITFREHEELRRTPTNQTGWLRARVERAFGGGKDSEERTGG